MGCKGSSVRITPSRPKNPIKSNHLAVVGFFYALCFLFVGQIYPTFYPTRVFAASQLGNGAACTLIFVRFQILLPEQFSERRMSLLPGELVAVDICFFCHPKSLVQSVPSSTTTVRVHQHAASGCGLCVERLVPQFSEEQVAVSHTILSTNNREFRRLRNHPLSNEPFAPGARGEGCGGPNSRGHLDRILPSESLARHEPYA